MQVASVHHEYGRLTLATAGLLFIQMAVLSQFLDVMQSQNNLNQAKKCNNRTDANFIKSNQRTFLSRTLIISCFDRQDSFIRRGLR